MRTELHNEGWIRMASSGKKKTTMAKLTRESRLRERRLDKQARKDARKRAAAHHPDAPVDTMNEPTGESARPGADRNDLEAAVHAPTEAAAGKPRASSASATTSRTDVGLP